jgi:DNA-binding NarL/FixJ family response regulator
MRVLLVEDDDFDAESVKQDLKNAFEDVSVERIVTGSDFHAQFDRIKENPPGLIIMDLLLRWADPENAETKRMPSEGASSNTPIGLRCIELMMSDTRTRLVPVILYSHAIGMDLTALGLPPHIVRLSKGSAMGGLVPLIGSMLTAGTRRKALQQRVFIVHGHDDEAKETVARFIEKLGLRAIILHEQPNRGQAVIEKFEDHANVAFAIVLLTGDDVGASEKSPKDLRPRARQNVIFELGFFAAKLGRRRVCALLKADIEVPSDYQGVIYITMDRSGGWRTQLAGELKSAGLDVDLNKIL